jgi:hypothetical protein
VRLGTNALVQVDGTVHASSVFADSISSSSINGTSVVRTLHAAQAISTRDMRRDVAIQSFRTSAALRAATQPDAVSKDLRRDIAIQSIRTSAALREATKPSASKDYQSDIQRLRDEAAYDRRDIFRPSPISKNYDRVIAELKSRAAASQTKLRAPVTVDYAPRFKRLSDAIVSVQRLVEPVFAASYTAVINTLKAMLSVIRQDVRALKTRKNVVVPDSRPALKRLTDRVIGVQRLVKPTASKSYDRQIAALKTSTAGAAVDNTSMLRRLIKPTASKSYDRQIAALRTTTASTAVDNTSMLRRLIKPTASKSYDRQIAALKTTTASAAVDNTSMLRRLIKPTASKSYDRKVASLQALLTGKATIDTAIVDKLSVSQLTGIVSSLKNIPANTALVTLGVMSFSFQGSIRVMMTNTNTLPTVTHIVTLNVDCLGNVNLKPTVTMTHSPNAAVQVTPAQGIQSVYFNGSDYSTLCVKTGTVDCHIYVSAINSDPLLGNNGDDGFYEGIYTGGTVTSNAFIIDVNTPIIHGSDVKIIGNLTNTGDSVSLCRRNNGNQIEMSAGGGAAYIDFHAGADADNIDYNGRIIQQGNNMSISAVGQLLLTGSTGVNIQQPLNCGQVYGQVINLTNDKQWGIGLQTNAGYFRSPNSFHWFKGGVHSDTQGDAGASGVLQAYISDTGNMYLRGGNATTTTVPRSNRSVLRSGVQGVGAVSSGFVSFGITYTAIPVVTVSLDDAGGTIASIYVNNRTTSGFNWNASNSGGGTRSIQWMASGDAS